MIDERRGKVWKAPAKINLFLHITSQREDGYHNLQTIFQFLDYCDGLQFIPRTDDKIVCHYHQNGMVFENDLILKAVYALKQQADKKQRSTTGLDIYLDKVLPMGGGLGGGSSDAATTLVALNDIWQLGLSKHQLAEIGLTLGADVPVFVNGESVWAEGVGEKFTPVELAQPCYLVLAPDVHVATGELFKHPELNRNMPVIKVEEYIPEMGINVFESLVREKYSGVDQALTWLQTYAPARMTGTGACVFATFESSKKAEGVLAKIPGGMTGFIANGRNKSPLYCS